jgi:mono/diheme cytochrome c family protein
MPDPNHDRASRGTRRRKLRRWLGILVLAGVGVLVAWEHARTWRAGPQREQTLALGERLYAENCAPCHGAHMQGAPGEGPLVPPPLVKFGFRFFFWSLPGGMEGFVRDQITGGAEGMPEFATRLSAREIDALAYLIHQSNL